LLINNNTKKVYLKLVDLLASKIFIFLIIFLVSFSFINDVFGQINLSYPKNRMVLQRNTQNLADIFIEGTVGGSCDMVQARLTTLDNAGQPVIPNIISNWINIASPINGNFSGALFNQTGGWYILEIQATNLGQPIGSSIAIKVGIGEVFVVAGQSNAEGGLPNIGTVFGPTDDRVNCINLFDDTTTNAPEMAFSHLESLSNIAPRGVTAWCWGAFGETLASNWNVPVLVFNAAIGNTGIFQWRAAANGEVDYCGHTADSVRTCMPYYYLKKTLTGYVQKTGIRAILWHQGENDYGIFEGGGFPPDYYYSNIKQVIDKTRSDYQANISWVIAKVSRVCDSDLHTTATSARVTDGQQMMIDEPNYNTYLGPLSDNIQPSEPERDRNHFWGQGLIDLGNAWFANLNTGSFLSNSTPQKGKFTIAGCSSLKSGDWNDVTVWSGGRVPNLNDDVILNAGHVVALNNVGHAKNLILKGELQMGSLGELKFLE
jgi:Carbohydrate esterase, sialic acid-specific acetylesterase